jgi:hypothetical protein
VAFHVEIRRSLHRARAFNLSEEKLRRTIVEPWRSGGPVDLGDQQWNPDESALTILEGPELSPPDLAMGRGWNNAERSAANVTGAVLEDAAADALVVAVFAETAAGLDAAIRLLDRIGVRAETWAAVRDRPNRDVVVLLVAERAAPAGAWMFEAGLALGALGRRAIVAQLGSEAPPPALRGLDVVRLDPDEQASLQALAERLRAVRSA